MASIERIIGKLLIVQFVLLILIQGFLHQLDYFKDKSPLLLYEGASGIVDLREQKVVKQEK